MALNGLSAQLYLTANTASLNATSKQIQGALGRITGNASEFQKSLDASTARVFAFGATTSVIAGVGAALTGLVRSTIEVEASLAQVQSVLGGTVAQLSAFREEIFKVAQGTGQTFASVAEAATEFARQGLSAVETTKRLNDALILTRITGLDSVKSVEALTAAINGFQSAGLSSAQVVNKLAAVDKAFAVSSKDLTEAFSRAGSTAEDAGVSFDELLGIVTAVQQTTSRGGAVIGNALKTIFTRIGRGGVIEDLKGLGVQIDESQSGIQKLKALSDAIESTNNPTQKAAIKEKAGGAFQINIVSAALKDLSSESSIFTSATQKAADATNEAYKQNEVLNETLKTQLNSLIVGFTNLSEKIGQITFAPILKELLGLANGAADFLNKAFDPEKGNKLIQGLFKTIGSFLAGPGLIIFTTAFVKIFSLVGKYAKEGFKSILQIGTQTEKIHGLEAGLVNLLKRDDALRKAIESTTLSQVDKQKAIAAAIRNENKLLEEQKLILRSIATVAYRSGARSFADDGRILDRKGKPVTNASGYIPNFAAGYDAEKTGAREHGYVAGAVRKTRIHDGNGKSFESFVNTREKITHFTNGNGKKATIVRPPNGFGKGTQFAKGFAAEGYTPNFAESEEEKFIREFSKLTTKERAKRLAFLEEKRPDSVAVKVLRSLANTSTSQRASISKEANAKVGNSRSIPNILKEAPKEDSNGLILNSNPNGLLVQKGILSKEALEKYRVKNPDGSDSKTFVIGNQKIREASINFEGEKFKKAQRIEAAKQQRRDKFIDEYEIDAQKLGGIALVSPRLKSPQSRTARSSVNKIPALFQVTKARKGTNETTLFDKNLEEEAGNEIVKINNIIGTGVPEINGVRKDVSTTSADINKIFAGGIINLADSLYGRLFDVKDRGDFAKKLVGFASGDAGGLLPAAAEGSLFEAASKVALSSMGDMEKVFNSSDEQRPFDFRNAAAMQSILGVTAERGEGKRLGGDSFQDEVNSVVKKTFNDDLYGPKALAEVKNQRANSPNRILAQKKTAENRAAKAAEEEKKTANSAAGFIPNFASVGRDPNGNPTFRKNKLLGSGFYGDFFQLNNNRRGEQNIGVKKFKSKKFSQSTLEDIIKDEYASSKILSEIPLVRGITGPKVIGSLKRSLEAKRVGKRVVSDPTGREAIGRDESNQLGDVMANLLATKGLMADDLHGSNYTLNDRATKFIQDDDSHLTLLGPDDRDDTSNTDFFNKFASQGGLAHIVDAGYLKPTTSFLKDKYKEFSTLTNSSGFMPNFAMGNLMKGRNVFQINWMKEMAKKRKLKVNPLGFPSDPEDVAKLGGEFNKIYPNGQGMLAMSKGFVPNFSVVSDLNSVLTQSGGTGGLQRPQIRSGLQRLIDSGETWPTSGTALDYTQVSALNNRLSLIRSTNNGYTRDGYTEQLVDFLVPKVSLPNSPKKIAQKSASDLSLDDQGTFKVDFLRSRGGNPLFEIAKLIKKRQIKRINAGAIIGPRIPSLLVGLQKMVESERIKDPTYPRIPIDGYFSPKKLGDKMIEGSEAELKKKYPYLYEERYNPNSGLSAGKDFFPKKDQKNLILSYKALGVNRKEEKMVDLSTLFPQGLASGFIPNFSALNDAISREKKAGVPASKIYIDSSPALVSSKNPFGQMVANTRDEPMGGHQGIARARKEGKNPKSYGNAGGFIPNYAFQPQLPNAASFPSVKGSKTIKLDPNTLNSNLNTLKYLGIAYEKNNVSLKEFLNISKNVGKSLGLTGKDLNFFLKDLNNQVKDFETNKAKNSLSGKANNIGKKSGKKDILGSTGTLGLQFGLSALPALLEPTETDSSTAAATKEMASFTSQMVATGASFGALGAAAGAIVGVFGTLLKSQNDAIKIQAEASKIALDSTRAFEAIKISKSATQRALTGDEGAKQLGINNFADLNKVAVKKKFDLSSVNSKKDALESAQIDLNKLSDKKYAKTFQGILERKTDRKNAEAKIQSAYADFEKAIKESILGLQKFGEIESVNKYIDSFGVSLLNASRALEKVGQTIDQKINNLSIAGNVTLDDKNPASKFIKKRVELQGKRETARKDENEFLKEFTSPTFAAALKEGIQSGMIAGQKINFKSRIGNNTGYKSFSPPNLPKDDGREYVPLGTSPKKEFLKEFRSIDKNLRRPPNTGTKGILTNLVPRGSFPAKTFGEAAGFRPNDLKQTVASAFKPYIKNTTTESVLKKLDLNSQINKNGKTNVERSPSKTFAPTNQISSTFAQETANISVAKFFSKKKAASSLEKELGIASTKKSSTEAIKDSTSLPAKIQSAFREGQLPAVKTTLESAGINTEGELGKKLLDSLAEKLKTLNTSVIDISQSTENYKIELKALENEINTQNIPKLFNSITKGFGGEKNNISSFTTDLSKAAKEKDLKKQGELFKKLAPQAEQIQSQFSQEFFNNLVKNTLGPKFSEVLSKISGKAVGASIDSKSAINGVRGSFDGQGFRKVSLAEEKVRKDPSNKEAINDLIKKLSENATGQKGQEKIAPVIAALKAQRDSDLGNKESKDLEKEKNLARAELDKVTKDLIDIGKEFSDSGLPAAIKALTISMTQSTKNNDAYNKFSDSLTELTNNAIVQMDVANKKILALEKKVDSINR